MNGKTYRLQSSIEVRFWKSEGGAEPVREWLKKECGSDDREAIGQDIRHVQVRWPVSRPKCAALGGGLDEVRSNLRDGRIARVIFCFHADGIVLLHGFIKKTRKTPASELALATIRMKQMTG